MKFKLFSSALVVAFALSGCAKESNPQQASMTLSPESLSFEAKDNLSKTVSVTSNRDWKIENTEDWLTFAIDGKSTAGKTIPASSNPVTVTVTALENTGIERGAQISFNGGTLAKKTLSITQGGNQNYTSISDVRAMLGPSDSKVTIDPDTYVKALVTNANILNNFTSRKTIYVQDGTGGLCIFASKDIDTGTFTIGDEVVIDLSGTSLELYNGVKEVNGLDIKKINKISSGKTVTATEVTSIEDFVNNKYEGLYVSIASVQVSDANLDKTWVQNNSHTSITAIEKTTGKDFVIQSSKYSTYGSKTVRELAPGCGTIKGIASTYNGKSQIIFTQESDWAGMKGERFEPEEIVTDRIALILQAAKDAKVTLKNVAVVAVSITKSTGQEQSSFLVEDAEKEHILIFGDPDGGAKIGDVVTVKGTLTEYGGMPQLTGPVVTKTGTAAVTYPDAQDITSTLDTFSSGKVVYISFTGTFKQSSEDYFNVEVEGATKRIGSFLKPDGIDVSPYKDVPNIKYTGYYLYTTNDKYVYLMLTKAEESTLPYLILSPGDTTVKATDTSASFKIQTKSTWTCTSRTTGFTVTPTSGTGNATITVTFDANTDTENARKAAIEVVAGGITKTFNLTQSKASSGKEVTIEAVFTKGAYGLPDADCKEDREFTVTGSDGNNYTFKIHPVDKFRTYEQNYLLFGKQGAYIETPAVNGSRLTKISILTGAGASKSVQVGIYKTDGTTEIVAPKKLDATGAIFDFDIAAPETATAYRFQIANAYNVQAQKMTFTFEK